MKVKNSINANEFSKNYKVFTQPSLTIPDQTMSIKVILERYARGLPVGGRLDEYYDEEDDLPNPFTLDLAERQEMAELYTKEINEIKSRKKQSTNVDNYVDNSTENKTDETES
jgi:hypothetical protein